MSTGLSFEWDKRKSQINREKHGISFEEAAVVFSDVNSITISDPDHSKDEDREITIGICGKFRILVVSHTDRNGHIRIISARKANRHEQLQYKQGI